MIGGLVMNYVENSLYEVSYVDKDTGELQRFQGNITQAQDVYDMWEKSNEIYDDVLHLQIRMI
jgi:hypothetical protein